MEASKVLFRASSIGLLMGGREGLTEKQAYTLKQLQDRYDQYQEQRGIFLQHESRLISAELLLEDLLARHEQTEYLIKKDGTVRKRQLGRRKKELARIRKAVSPTTKPLTDIQAGTLADLIEIRDTPFSFGATARSHIRKLWRQLEFGYKDVVITEELMKGNLVEQDSIDYLEELFPLEKGIRFKNKERKENEWYTGCCDVHIKPQRLIEDVKSSWTLPTFDKVDKAPELYYAQGQCYMDLYDCDRFRLYYCLVNTPEELVAREVERMWYRLGRPDDDNKVWEETSEQILANHNYDHIPVEHKVKVFEFHRDDDYIQKMRDRVELARQLYATFTLTQPIHEED